MTFISIKRSTEPIERKLRREINQVEFGSLKSSMRE